MTLRVSRERWSQAQAWERNHWVHTQALRSKYGKTPLWWLLSRLRILPAHRGDDWNLWWQNQFEGYRFLPASVANAIELGCGPYTNMRLILQACTPDHIVLSDPLIHTYARFHLTFVSQAYRLGTCVLDDHPAEECPYRPGYFDLVVMINVLDHVQDASLALTNAAGLVKPGGTLIIGQDLTNEEDLAAQHDANAEIGHPIKIDHAILDSALAGFRPILRKRLEREEGRAPSSHYGTYVFAGTQASRCPHP